MVKEITKKQQVTLESLDWFDTKKVSSVDKGGLIITLKRKRNGRKTSSLTYNSMLIKHILSLYEDLPILPDPKDPINGPKKRELRFAISFGKSRGDNKYITFNPSNNMKHYTLSRGSSSATLNNHILIDAFWVNLGIKDDVEDLKLKLSFDTRVQGIGLYTFVLLNKEGKPFFNKK